eukprot:scaffold244340_cov35-Tisochrysis_lutea.AAC.3
MALLTQVPRRRHRHMTRARHNAIISKEVSAGTFRRGRPSAHAPMFSLLADSASLFASGWSTGDTSKLRLESRACDRATTSASIHAASHWSTVTPTNVITPSTKPDSIIA